MPDIQPFRGLRYRVPPADLGKVLSPPYDVISPAYRDELYARDPRNVVRVVLSRNQSDSAYEEAGATFRGWMAAGLLAPDPEPRQVVALHRPDPVVQAVLHIAGTAVRVAQRPGAE